MWKTGPVGNVQRAILQDGTVIAVADTMEHAARIVRLLNDAELASFQEFLKSKIEGTRG